MRAAPVAKGDYSHPVVRPAWLDRVREDVLEPELPIVDPHHHLWHDRPAGRYLLEELLADLTAATTSSPPCSCNAAGCGARTGRRSSGRCARPRS